MTIDGGISSRLMSDERWLPPYEVTVEYCVEEFERDESLDLVEDLQSMVNNREYSDMTFLCKDGREIHASRMLLAASCCQVLLIRTTGGRHVEKTGNFSIGKTPLRIHGGYAELLRMVQILVSHDLSEVTISNLSKDAFMFYLKSIREQWPPTLTSSWMWSLEEYRKLTQVLIWCLRSAGSKDVACLSSTQSVARFLRNGDQLELFKNTRPGLLSGHPSEVALKDFEILLPDSTKNDFSALIAMVNLTCIHPDVLFTVVNPSRIIDAEELTKVLRIQAVLDCHCLRNSCLRSTPNLFCRRTDLRVPTSRIAFERCNSRTRDQRTYHADTQMHFYGNYQWTIVPSLQDGFNISSRKEETELLAGLQIGFCKRLYGESLPDSMYELSLPLSRDKRGWVLEISDDAGSAKFQCYPPWGQNPWVWVLPAGKQFTLDKGIEVRLNIPDQICSFSYDESSISVALRNLQGGFLYPAVSFQSILLRVSIIFREGFDQEVVSTDEGFKRGEVYIDQ
ncbi:hypothetical protein R1sor_015160 [Riccia sorocarpa]|uniref:BTB domain-containing protein n=1 Tax=Riccia sorocarpa TaxID=122646 RepID=A0ABD3HDB6_9MARC